MIGIKVGQLQAQADWQLRRRNLKRTQKGTPEQERRRRLHTRKGELIGALD